MNNINILIILIFMMYVFFELILLQVRKIVTALLALGIGKITEKDITVMLQVPGHKNYITSLGLVPPHGLYLLNVGYNQNYLDEHIIKYRISDDGIVIPLNED